jgi:hypothetical protein
MKRFFLFIILSATAYAAIPTGNATQWDVRTTGNDNNGGAFITTGTGTDFSTQDSPQVSYTDLLVGTPNTTVTSVIHPFGATAPGNVINITAGTGFTPGRYVVTGVVGVVATLDTSPGATGSSLGVGALGGAMGTIPGVNGVIVAGNVVNVQTGTYGLAAALVVTVNSTWIGFQTVHKDRGTKPLIRMVVNSQPLITANIAGNTYLSLQNLSLSNVAAVRAVGINGAGGPSNNLLLSDLILDGFTTAVDATGNFLKFISAVNTEIKNSTADAIIITSATNNTNQLSCSACYIHNNVGAAVNASNATVQKSVRLVNSILTLNANGVLLGSGLANILEIVNSDLSLNTTDAVVVNGTGSGVTSTNSIYWGNGGHAFNFVTGATFEPSIVGFNNAYGGQGVSNFVNVAGSPGDIALGADPFTSATDFSLNSATTGGLRLRGAGYPGVFPGGTTTGFLDVGAVQTPKLPTGGGFVGEQ